MKRAAKDNTTPSIDGGWQVVVFAQSDRRPFALPAPYRWLPGEAHVRGGTVHPSQTVNVLSKEIAESLALIAKDHGFSGLIRPRFSRRIRQA